MADKKIGRNTVKGRSIGAAIMTILSAPAGFKIGQNTKKALRKAMSPGPKKKRKLGPDIRARKSAISTAQKKAGGKGLSEGALARREAARGKVGPKRNVIKDKKGKVIRDKKGRAIKGGSKSAFQKRLEERKRGGGK